MWYIGVTIFYLNLPLPLYTNFQAGIFPNEARCVRYLSENRRELEDSFKNSFDEYEYEGKKYKMEAYRFECKQTGEKIEV